MVKEFGERVLEITEGRIGLGPIADYPPQLRAAIEAAPDGGLTGVVEAAPGRFMVVKRIVRFMLMALIGKQYGLSIFAVAFENLAGGMGTSAFVSLLMAICNHRYTATQYALLSSLAALGRIFISPSSGFLVASIGWAPFFFVTFLVAIPGLILLWWLRDVIEGMKPETE